MSVNRFDTTLPLLLNSLFDCFVQLQEIMCKYLDFFRITGSVENGKRLIRLFIVIYVTLANFTEQA